jgi:GT2 family glycosyltransferase
MKSEEKGLDVIIPSYWFDLNSDCIISIASLSYRADWQVSFYLIGDKPGVTIPPKIQAFIDSSKIIFIANDKNRGLNYSRNKGIDLSKRNWILILDDDIIPHPNLLFAYITAIEKNPDAAGFAGVVNFPTPFNDFTKALEIAGYTYFFSLAKYRTTLPWTTGANMLFNRSKIGKLRFSDKFSGSEGGDEVEFAIRLKEKQYTSDMIAVPGAEVLHPWWHDGKTNYRRAFKYSRGNYRLLKLHPQFTVYRFCNLIELILLLLIVLPIVIMIGISWTKYLLFIIGAVLADVLIHTIKLIKEENEITPGVIFHTWFLKIAEQTGYASACIENFYLKGFIQKFDIELRSNKNHFHTNRWLLLKVILYMISGIVIFVT